MTNEIKSTTSGTVSSIATITLIGGLIGLFGSFIPCLGILSLYISVPSSILGVFGIFIAHNQKSLKGYIAGATTVAIVGALIAYSQYAALTDIAKGGQKFLKDDSNLRKIRLIEEENRRRSIAKENRRRLIEEGNRRRLIEKENKKISEKKKRAEIIQTLKSIKDEEMCLFEDYKKMSGRLWKIDRKISKLKNFLESINPNAYQSINKEYGTNFKNEFDLNERISELKEVVNARIKSLQDEYDAYNNPKYRFVYDRFVAKYIEYDFKKYTLVIKSKRKYTYFSSYSGLGVSIKMTADTARNIKNMIKSVDIIYSILPNTLSKNNAIRDIWRDRGNILVTGKRITYVHQNKLFVILRNTNKEIVYIGSNEG